MEGTELELLESWIRRGTIKNVRQIGVEIHWADKKLQVRWLANLKIPVKSYAKSRDTFVVENGSKSLL